MTRDEALERLKATKPSWLEDGKGLMGDRTPYKPSEKPYGSVEERKHDLSIASGVEIGSVEPEKLCRRSVGDFLTATAALIIPCACKLIAGEYWRFSFERINGEHELTWVDNGDGTGVWINTDIGTVTSENHGLSSDCSSTPSETFEDTFFAIVTCTGRNRFETLFRAHASDQIVFGGSVGEPIATPLDTETPNESVCSFDDTWGSGGTVKLTIPPP